MKGTIFGVEGLQVDEEWRRLRASLLTGRPSFQGTTMVEKISRIRQDEPVKPTKFQLSIPHPFEGLVLKLLAKNPEDRYQSATAMLKELDRIARNHSVTV